MSSFLSAYWRRDSDCRSYPTLEQIHRHLVLFLHIALENERLFLEHIPHLRTRFAIPAELEGGRYRTPQEPGDMKNC